VYIREEEIMRFTKLDQQTLYQKLLLLSRFHVLHYIPARRMPAIFYLEPRLEDEELRIPHTIYEQRRERQKRRIDAMIEYAENDSECRLVQLLHYFGEELDHRCGHCDVCLSEGLNGNIHEERAMIRQLILDLLQSRGPLAPQQILGLIKADPERVGNVLHELVEDEDLTLSDGIIRLRAQ